MCVKLAATKAKAKYLAEQIEIKFGTEQLQKAKLLVGNKLFIAMYRARGILSLEAYLRRFFSIIITYASVFNFTYFTEDKVEHQSWHCDDDLLFTAAAYAVTKIRARMIELGKITEYAKSLKPIGIGRRFDGVMDVAMEKLQEFNYQRFGVVVEHLRVQGYEELVEAYEMLVAEEGRQMTVFMVDCLHKMFTALRRLYDEGKTIAGQVSFEDSGMEYSSLDLKEAFGKGGDFNVEVDDEDDIKMVRKYAKKFGYQTAVNDSETSIFVTKGFDPFSLIGGVDVDFNGIGKINFRMQQAEAGSQMVLEEPKQTPQNAPKKQVSTDLSTYVERWGTTGMTQQEVRERVYFGDEKLETAISSMSNRSKLMWFRPVLQERKTIDEAIEEAANALERVVKNESGELTREDFQKMAAGQLVAKKGQLRFFQGMVERL